MHMQAARQLPLGLIAISFVCALLGVPSAARAQKLTEKSPEVIAAVQRGIDYLSVKGLDDKRPGAIALAGLSLLKHDESPDHPMVVKCAEEIVKSLGTHDINKLPLNDEGNGPIYSAGMCILFLCKRDPVKHRADIECLLQYLRAKQKPHGGWGYSHSQSGDTSMTQYGVLSAWTAMRAGFKIPTEQIDAVTIWLLRTQDPSGGFGYQGILGEGNTLVKQNEIRPGLSAAGLGSVYICANMLGISSKLEKREEEHPSALKEVKPKAGTPEAQQQKPKTRVNSQQVHECMARGNQWFAANFTVDAGTYNYYYLYAYERYKSFWEMAEGKEEKDPQWYSDIARHLLKKQKEDGSWQGDCGAVSDTAFCLLFLLRSMKKELPDYLGDGTMLGGRGLPKNTKGAEVVDGKVVARKSLGPAEQLIAQLDKWEDKDFSEKLPQLEALPSDKVESLDKGAMEKIRKLVANEKPEARIVAVRLLGATRNLDNVEVLLYALTDPDPSVVIAANEALSRIRRSPDAVILPNNFTPEDRRLAIDKWKAWYLSIRPDVELE